MNRRMNRNDSSVPRREDDLETLISRAADVLSKRNKEANRQFSEKLERPPVRRMQQVPASESRPSSGIMQRPKRG